MAIKKIIMRPEGGNDYADELHPKTSADMVEGLDKTAVGLENVDNKKQMPISGDTFTGIASGQANTSYTVAQLRNIIISTGNPSGGSNGDIWIKYV
jgi:hypothetical protein